MQHISFMFDLYFGGLWVSHKSSYLFERMYLRNYDGYINKIGSISKLS
jgi:hypothetical protein